MPSTSRPCRRAGMVRAWMGVGTVYLAASRARNNGSARPRSANETLLTGNKVLLTADRASRARVCGAAFGPFPRAAGTALFWGLSRDEAPSNERRVARSREILISPQGSGLARI